MIYLEFDQDQWEYACDHVWQDIYVPAQLTCNGITMDCQFRIRGATSRTYPKKSIRIEPAGGQHIFGYDELNLNAEYLDKTRLREMLSYMFYTETEQIVPEVNLVELVFNGDTQGPYLSVQDVDSDFLLNTQLPDESVIYKCADRYTTLDRVDDLTPYSKKTHENQPWDDLTLLIYWLQLCPDEYFRVQLQQRFYYQDLLSCVATNVLLGHGSTYYHNYHLLLDRTGAEGKWRYITWDMDRTWGKYGPEFPYWKNSSNNGNRRNTLLWRMWCDPVIRDELIQEIHNQYPLITSFAESGVIDSLATIIAPLVEVDPYREFTMDAFWTAINAVSNWPYNRYDYLATQFSQWPLPFHIQHPAVTGSDLMVNWDGAGTGCTWRLTISYDSLFSTPGDVVYDVFTQDTFHIVPEKYIDQELWLQVFATRNSVEHRAANGPVECYPVPDIAITGSVVISEINYMSSPVFNPGDWLEIVNTGDHAVSLDGWSVRDGNPENLTTLGNLIMQPEECLVFASDSFLFMDAYLTAPSPQSALNFSLSNSGEILTISDPMGFTLDTLRYSSDPPWPQGAAGTGSTLILQNLDDDNTNPFAWIAGPFGGTPFTTGDWDPDWPQNGAVSIRPVGPLPVTGDVTFLLTAIASTVAELTLFDLAGRAVSDQVDLLLDAGQYSLTVETDRLPTGLYVAVLRNMGYTESVKFILLGEQ